MSMKPVRGIILNADRDLVALVREHPEIAQALGRVFFYPDSVPLYVYERDSQGGYDIEKPIMVYADSFGADEPEVVERLKKMGVDGHSHVVEGRSAPLAARLICVLAGHARLAVDNDYGVLLSADEFRALGPERQAEFVVGAGDFYRLGPIADLERPDAGTHDPR